jgi:hypothetical protein
LLIPDKVKGEFQLSSAIATDATMSAQTLLVAATGKHAALLVTRNTAHSSEGVLNGG